MDSSSIYLYRTTGPFSYLVVTNDSNSRSYVFSLDMMSGAVVFYGLNDIDVFSGPKAATSKVKNSNPNHTEEYLGKFLIGATVFGQNLVIATIMGDKECAYVNGSSIRQITDVIYTTLKIANGNSETGSLLDFNIQNSHFFSRSLDLSTTFPYDAGTNPDSEFCWNKRWILPFKIVGAAFVCCIIFQGAARSLNLDPKAPKNITYILKRSSANPGTRYISRGMDQNGNPANECECDLIFSDGDNYKAVSWRRGSCPIFWSTTLSSSIGAPTHKVDSNSYVITHRYFERLKERFQVDKTIVVSLLDEDERHGEIDLLNAYKGAVETLNFVIFYQFDINNQLKFDTLYPFVDLLTDPIENSGMTCGSFQEIGTTRQKTVFRFNCVDSLDRTNLATFYYALMITSSICGCSIQDIPENIRDFLGSSFIEAGDIVSTHYTNTQAIRTGPIRALMSQTSGAGSDKTISLVRRYQNVAVDPTRQKTIMSWTDTSYTRSDPFQLDSTYLSLIPGPECYSLGLTSIGQAILEPRTRPFVFGPETEKKLLIMLPEELVIVSLSIYQYPSNFNTQPIISVSIGNSFESLFPFCHFLQLPAVCEETWSEYDLDELTEKSGQLPEDFRSRLAGRYVLIEFASLQEEFMVGNVRLSVRTPVDKIIYQTNNANPRLNEFSSSIKSDRLPDLDELIQIESRSIEYGVDLASKYQIFSRTGSNPFFYDLKSRLIQSEHNTCCFCGSTQTLKPLRINKDLPTLNEDRQHTIELCDECMSKWSWPIVRHDSIMRCKESTHLTTTELNKKPMVVSYASHFFSVEPQGVSDPSTILSSTVSSWEVQPGTYRMLWCFLAPCIIESVMFIASTEHDLEIELRLPNNTLLHTQKKSTSTKSKEFSILDSYDPVRSMYLTIKISSPSPLVRFHFLEAYGRIGEDYMYLYDISSPMGTIPAFGETNRNWKPEERAHVFLFDRQVTVTGIFIVPEKYKTASLMVSLFNGEEFRDSIPIVIPKVSKEESLFYPFESHFSDITKLKIYYLHREAVVFPLQVSPIYS